MDVPDLALSPGKSSMFTAPRTGLDPDLFGDGDKMLGGVRQSLLNHFHSKMGERYDNPQEWAHIWLAG